MLDGAIFYSSIVVCISLGSYYKQIPEPMMKKNYGAGLGILIAFLICGRYIYHSVLMTWGNIIIIKCCDKSYIHQTSLAFTWIYLLYLHFNISNIYIIWLCQTQALRLVGLAFEIRAMERAKNEPKVSTSKILDEASGNVPDPTAVDIISYAYYFIGLHKGPYYRWRTFNDHFKSPFGVLGDYRIITEQKLKKACIFIIGYNMLRLRFTPYVYYDRHFYVDYDTDLRYLYNLPQLVMHLLYAEFIAMLCTSVCTETGFGVYPSSCQPSPGHGPTTGFSLLNVAAETPDAEQALEQEYNFSMMKCFDYDKLLFGPRMRDTMKSWDMPTQYWFGTYIYRNLLSSNKEVRSAFSFLMFAIWHGPSLAQALVSGTLWVYVHLEAEYMELFNPQGSLKVPWEIGFSIMRILCLLYLTPCFVVQDISTILKYYNSIFWMYHIVLFFLILLSIVIYKSRVESSNS